MGLLAPLYALAALAIAAPVIFHLIRRQPRGQVEFSSLMFLQPSPPRLTRSSRLDNLWLLLIRASALGLIALAFARPFMRSAELADAQPAGRDILLLLDTSGSMQREDVWQAALEQATQYLHGLGSNDRIGLATFDTEMRVVVPLPEADEPSGMAEEAGRAAVLKELGRLQPSYRGTKLAEQLVAATELLQARSTARDAAAPGECEIVLISDLHEGAGLDALQGYAWPENVRLDVRRVAPAQAGNARATLMQAQAGDAEAMAALKAGTVRVRIENNASSSESGLTLRWAAGDQPPPFTQAATPESGVVHVQVPPGQARVVPVPATTGQADRLILDGDRASFDNVVYVPHTAPRQERLGFVGATPSKPEDDLFFFLSRVPLSTPVRNVSIERMQAQDLIAAPTDENLAGLVIEWPLSAALTPGLIPALEDYVRSGRPLVVVLSRPIASEEAKSDEAKTDDAATSESPGGALARLLGTAHSVAIREAAQADFALLTDIDFRHPLFQPLADAKFNDFGKVRFWSHRVIDLKSSDEEHDAGQLRVLARFDDHAPAILERRLGRGHVWLLAAGWQATASQLALSSKFVPLLYGMLDPEGLTLEANSVYEVGEPIDVTPGAAISLTDLNGAAVGANAAEGRLVLKQPGIYWLSEDGKRRQIAVALPLGESQLDPLDLDRFNQYGVVTAKSDSAQDRQAAARLSQVTELENRQKMWRWILVVAFGLLILETLLAARREKGSGPRVGLA